MSLVIKSIEFPMQLLGRKMGTVNCYLIKGNTGGFVLIDTAFPNRRADLEKEIESAGCRPGNLKLIVITHSDLDHTGNAAYLRRKYGAPIAMHRFESGVVENGDASLSRKRKPFLERKIGEAILKALSLLVRFGSFERFSPDITIDDGYDLSGYGLDAKVALIPGHSRGSIGILTPAGDLFCGDLLWNMGKPGAHSIVDDAVEMNASIVKLKRMGIKTVYPGHGQPFAMDQFLQTYQPAT